jgi:hypothetical protein
MSSVTMRAEVIRREPDALKTHYFRFGNLLQGFMDAL